MVGDQTSDSTEDLLPAEVVERLKHNQRVPFEIPESVDQQILSAAREHLKSQKLAVSRSGRSLRYVWQVRATVTTVAVMLLAAVWLATPQQPNAGQNLATAPQQVADSTLRSIDDVDGDGRVDILDAYALARYLAEGKDLPPEQDRDRDGRVTRNDVELLAGSVVML
jgi:hypothetical protein